MDQQVKGKGLYIDWILIITITLLALFGLVMVYSASFVFAYEMRGGDYTYFFNKQLQWLFISSGFLFFFIFFPYRHFRWLSKFIVLACFIGLALVFLPTDFPFISGVEVMGARRWVNFLGFQVQPSEFVKLGAIIYLAYVYSRKQPYINKFFSGVLPPLIVVAAFFVIIMLQPDLGTATSIVLVAGLIAYCSGAKKLHLISLGSLAAWALWHYATSAEYRFNRLVGHMTPFELEATQGYQLVQSYIAIAHGGLTGAGLGQSVQKLFYLPEAHTDFILAIISEELGIIGIGFVFACMLIIIIRGIIIGARCKDTFGSLLAFGIVFQLSVQMIFNAGAVNGLLPITGIPFPFISYGGSSLLVTFMSMGILVNISRKTEKDRQLGREEEDNGEAVVTPPLKGVKPSLRPVKTSLGYK